jgi:hypothetical protein
MGCVLVPTSMATPWFCSSSWNCSGSSWRTGRAASAWSRSAGAGDEAVAQPRIGARHGVGAHAHEGVAGAHVVGRRPRRPRSAAACRAGGRCCCRRCAAPGPARHRRRRSESPAWRRGVAWTPSRRSTLRVPARRRSASARQRPAALGRQRLAHVVALALVAVQRAQQVPDGWRSRRLRPPPSGPGCAPGRWSSARSWRRRRRAPSPSRSSCRSSAR